MDKSDNLTKHETKISSLKLKKKQSDLIKKIIPKSGSYDLNNNQESSNTNNYLNKEDGFMEEVQLNSAEPIHENNSKESDNNLTNTTHTTSPSCMNTTSSNRNNTNTDSTNNSHFIDSFNSVQYPKKKTLLGIPLLCFTYLAAIYSLLAYGATSLLSIIELMMNNSPKMLPLYLLLAGYLLITLMSFLLIVAIQRDNLNLILFWIISLSVFILPEIGLNIVLAENSFDWFNTNTGLYTLTALIIRIIIDLPCIGVILTYHINRTKRQNILQKMLKPIKRNIMNGEVLKSYNKIEISPTKKSQVNIQYPLIETMPLPENVNVNNKPNKNQSQLHNNRNIGFSNLLIAKDKNDQINSILVDDKYFPDKTLPNKTNVFHYRFMPGSSYEIHVRPSKTGDFVQRFVNIDDIKFNNETKSAYDYDYGKYTIESTTSNKKAANLNKYKDDEINTSNYKLQNNVLKNDDELRINSTTNTSKPRYVSIEKNLDFYEEESIMPIKIHREQERLANKVFQGSIKKNQMINVSNHQIYLPTPSSLISSQQQYAKPSSNIKYIGSDKVILNSNSNSNNHANESQTTPTYLKGAECNCINIASCSKDKIKEFIHSQDCLLSKINLNTTNSSASMNLSNPDLFIQRKHF